MGFYSVVAGQRTGTVQVRARSRADLNRLRRRFDIGQRLISTLQADYPFRMILPVRVWQKIAAKLAADAARYKNFKNEVAKISTSRAGTYHEVWERLKEIEGEGDSGLENETLEQRDELADEDA